MQASDVGRVAVLCGQLGYPSTVAQVRTRFDVLSRRPNEAMFVASAPAPSRDGARPHYENVMGIVGWVHVGETLTLESDASAEIFGLVVDEHYRGAGVGSSLMRAAEKWATEQGYGEVRLRSNVLRQQAHEFYRHIGYEVVKTQMTFRKRLRDRERTER